jgi:hypothetical protein
MQGKNKRKKRESEQGCGWLGCNLVCYYWTSVGKLLNFNSVINNLPINS